MIAKCHCGHCQGPIEFEVEGGGMTVECPHCNQKTVLMVPRAGLMPGNISQSKEANKINSGKRKRWLLFAAAAIAICFALFLGLNAGNPKYSDSAGVLGMILALVAGFLFYFAPSIMSRHKRNYQAIFILNLFLGWTFVGWVVAAVWATMKEPNEK